MTGIKNYTLLLGLCSLLSLTACTNGSSLLSLFSQSEENLDLDKDFKTAQVDGDFSIRVPSYMDADSSLHLDASLAFQHELKEVATLVLDENTSEIRESLPFLDGYNDSASFIENYTNIQLNLIAEGLLYPETGTILLKEIDENPASQVWMEGRIDGLDIAYFITCIEAKNKVYFVMSYTSKEKKSKFEDTFQKIGDSFRIINANSK